MQPNLEKKIALVKTEQKKTGQEDKVLEIENTIKDYELYNPDKYYKLMCETDLMMHILKHIKFECVKSEKLNHIHHSLITQYNEVVCVQNNVANLIAARNLKIDDEVYKSVYEQIRDLTFKRKSLGKRINIINLTYLEISGSTSKNYRNILDYNQKLLTEFKRYPFSKRSVSKTRAQMDIREDRNRIKQGFENFGAAFGMLSKLWERTNKNVYDDFDMPLFMKSMSDVIEELSAMNNEADLQYEEACGDIMERSLALQQASDSYLREWSSKFQGYNKLSFEYELFLKELSSNKKREKHNVSMADLETLKRYSNAFEACAKDVESAISEGKSIISKHAPGSMLEEMDTLIFSPMRQANPAGFVSPLDACSVENTFYPKLAKRNYDEYSVIHLESIFMLYEKSAYATAYDQLIIDCNIILERLENKNIKDVSSVNDIDRVKSVRDRVNNHLNYINTVLSDIYAFIVNADDYVYHHFNIRLEKMYNARDKLKKIYDDLQTAPFIPLLVVQLFFASIIEYAGLLKSMAYSTEKSYPPNINVYHPTSATKTINEIYNYFDLGEKNDDGTAFRTIFFDGWRIQEIFEKIERKGYLAQSDEYLIGLSTILSAAEKDLKELKKIRTKILEMTILIEHEDNLFYSLCEESSYLFRMMHVFEHIDLSACRNKLNNAYYQANREIAILSQQSKSIAKKTTEKLDSLPTSFPLITASVSANNSKNSLAISAPLSGKSTVQVVAPPQSPPAFACKAQSEAITSVKPVTKISSFVYFKPSSLGKNEYRFGLLDRNVEYEPGDCFFYAVIANRPDKNWNKQQLRQSIHDELLNSRSAYEDIFVLRDKDGDYFIDFWDALLRKSKTIKFKTYEDYCRHVLVDKMSVDEVEISAFAKANDVCCVIVCKESGEVKIYQSLWAGDENPPIILGRINNNHYVALECPPQVTWQEIFKKMNAQSNVPALKGY